MGLDDEVLHGVYSYGFTKPSIIQQKAIVPLTKDINLIGQSQSGTGKTGAFIVGALQTIINQRKRGNKRGCGVLVITPTRELATQVYNVATSIGQHMDLKSCKCIGGSDHRQNIEQLRRGCELIVGTPGRVYDMLTRKALNGLQDEKNREVHSEKMVEIDFKAGTPVRTGDQFGVGRAEK